VTELLTAENGIAFLTLAALEIVLGIDNVVFLSILVGRLPEARRGSARRVGLLLAMLMRIGLLFAIAWIMRLSAPLFEVLERPFSGRDLILLGGGLFLIAKATWEIHDKLEGAAHDAPRKATATFGMVIAQIVAVDLVFSLDSVITAVGMAKHLSIMIAAVVVAVAAMMVFAKAVGEFVDQHPTIKILALAFLILIGVMLVAEALGQHIGKGTIYFAMAFSLGVELLNLRLRAKTAPVRLRRAKPEGSA